MFSARADGEAGAWRDGRGRGVDERQREVEHGIIAGVWMCHLHVQLKACGAGAVRAHQHMQALLQAGGQLPVLQVPDPSKTEGVRASHLGTLLPKLELA